MSDDDANVEKAKEVSKAMEKVAGDMENAAQIAERIAKNTVAGAMDAMKKKAEEMGNRTTQIVDDLGEIYGKVLPIDEKDIIGAMKKVEGLKTEAKEMEETVASVEEAGKGSEEVHGIKKTIDATKGAADKILTNLNVSLKNIKYSKNPATGLVTQNNPMIPKTWN